MVDKTHFETVKGVSQLHVRLDNSLSLKLVTAKVIDDLLLAGNLNELNNFSSTILKRFWASRIIIDERITFNG